MEIDKSSLPPFRKGGEGGFVSYLVLVIWCLFQYLVVVDFFQSQFMFGFLLDQEGEKLF